MIPCRTHCCSGEGKLVFARGHFIGAYCSSCRWYQQALYNDRCRKEKEFISGKPLASDGECGKV